MGGTQSHEDKKTIDATGEVVNNVVVQAPVEVLNTDRIVILLTILCVLKVISLIIFTYGGLIRKLKKKYKNNQNA